MASDPAYGAWFGRNISLSGDTIIAGSPNLGIGGGTFTPFISSGGAAYVFERDEGGADGWGEVKKLQARDAEPYDNFGHGLSISGDTIIVGAHTEDDPGINAGSAYVFERNEGGINNWGEVQKFTGSHTTIGDSFAFSVSVDGDTAVLGERNHEEDGEEIIANFGAAYVFTAEPIVSAPALGSLAILILGISLAALLIRHTSSQSSSW